MPVSLQLSVAGLSAVRYIIHDITIVDVGVLIGWPSARCRAVPCGGPTVRYGALTTFLGVIRDNP